MNVFGFSRSKVSLLLCSTFIGFGGCVADRQTAFNPSDFSAATRKGSGVVTGQVSVDTPNQGTIHPHSQPIFLTPVNAYTTENVQRRFVNGENLHKADPRVSSYERSAVTDDQGNFTIRGVPSGDYYLQGDMPWITSYMSYDPDTGDERLYVAHFKYYFARVSVKDGQTARVTQFDQRARERHTHYATGGTLYHPPANVEVFDQ